MTPMAMESNQSIISMRASVIINREFERLDERR